MTVEDLLSRISSRELAEWMAYEQVEGRLGPGRADIHAGIIAATVANANRAKGRAARPQDFIPRWDRRRVQSVEEQVKVAYRLNAMFGGTVRRGISDGCD